MKVRTLVLGLIIVPGLIFSQTLYAKEFGIISDVIGQPNLERNGEHIPTTFGVELLVGDVIELPARSELVVVAYESCEEWTLAESGRVVIADEWEITYSKGLLISTRQLPVCYQPENFAYEGPNVISGTLLRSAMNGPDANERFIAELQNADDINQLSNSELMSLLVYDLQNDNKEQARRYFDILMKKNPEAQIPAPILEKIEGP